MAGPGFPGTLFQSLGPHFFTRFPFSLFQAQGRLCLPKWIFLVYIAQLPLFLGYIGRSKSPYFECFGFIHAKNVKSVCMYTISKIVVLGPFF